MKLIKTTWAFQVDFETERYIHTYMHRQYYEITLRKCTYKFQIILRVLYTKIKYFFMLCFNNFFNVRKRRYFKINLFFIFCLKMLFRMILIGAFAPLRFAPFLWPLGSLSYWCCVSVFNSLRISSLLFISIACYLTFVLNHWGSLMAESVSEHLRACACACMRACIRACVCVCALWCVWPSPGVPLSPQLFNFQLA